MRIFRDKKLEERVAALEQEVKNLRMGNVPKKVFIVTDKDPPAVKIPLPDGEPLRRH